MSTDNPWMIAGVPIVPRTHRDGPWSDRGVWQTDGALPIQRPCGPWCVYCDGGADQFWGITEPFPELPVPAQPTWKRGTWA